MGLGYMGLGYIGLGYDGFRYAGLSRPTKNPPGPKGTRRHR